MTTRTWPYGTRKRVRVESIQRMSTTTKQIDPEIIAQREAMDRELYQGAYDYIKANALKKKSFRDAAALINKSPFHFHRNFARIFGITPKKLQTSVQIEAVKEMLLKGIPLPEIAVKCGFAHQSHMTARFKSWVKESPMRWVKAEKTSREIAAKN